MDVRWESRIKAAEGCGHFTTRDKELVGDWKTCAVGEIATGRGTFGSALIAEEEERSEYLEESLTNLGIRFTVAIYEDNVSGARRVYDRIQKLYAPKESLASA